MFLGMNGLQTFISGIMSFCLSFWIYKTTRCAEIMATALFCYMAPKIYLSFVAGAIVDRVGNRFVLRFSVAIGFIIYLTASLFWNGTSLERISFVYGLEGILGVTSAFYDVAFLASLPSIVPPKYHTTAYGLMEVLNGGVILLAPLLGSFLYAHTSFPSLFMGAAWMSFLFWIFLFFQPLKRSDMHPKKLLHFQTFSWLKKHPVLYPLLCYFTRFNILQGLSAGLVTAYVLERCLGKIETFTYFSMLLAFGTGAGSLLTLWMKRWDPWKVIFWSGFGAALGGRIAFGLTSHITFLCFWGFLRASLTPLMNTANQVLWTHEVPPDRRGKVFGARRLVAQGGFPLAIWFGGLFYRLMNDLFHGQLGLFFVFLGSLEALSTFTLAWRYSKTRRRKESQRKTSILSSLFMKPR